MHSFLNSQDAEKSPNGSSGSQEKSLRRQIQEQRNEIIFRSEVAVQLAEKVVVLRRQLRCLEENSHRANESPPASTALSPITTATPSAATALTSPNAAVPASSSAASAECVDLQRRLAEMEAQTAAWRQNVKAALRESQERERSLLAERTALEERLHAANFQLEASALRGARRQSRVSRETQTEVLQSPCEAGSSPVALSASSLVESMPRETTRRQVFLSPPEAMGKGAAPLPFIVAVHYENAEGWGVETKVRVAAGMTVSQLKESCCAQFYERHQRQVDPCGHCICTTHHKTGKDVVLSDYRELHSFAYFQRCEREKIPITLFLNPVDTILRVVNDAMDHALLSPEQRHRQASV